MKVIRLIKKNAAPLQSNRRGLQLLEIDQGPRRLDALWPFSVAFQSSDFDDKL